MLEQNHNKANNRGGTPLHYAAQRGYKDVVQLLLNAGAEPHNTNYWGQTPQHLARQCGYKDIANIIRNAVIKHQ